MIDWIIANKEWFFSGAGVFLLTLLAIPLAKKDGRKIQSQKSGNNSTNYQAGGDIKIGHKDDK